MKNVRQQISKCVTSWAILLLFFSFAATALTPQADTPSETQSDNPPSRVARISFLKGNVSFLRAGLDQWSDAALNFPATTGDRLYTDKGAKAELQVGPYTVRMWENTDLTITNLNDQIMQLNLSQGELRITVRDLASGQTVEVDTPNGALTVLEPGKYRFDVDPDGNQSLVSVISGRLQVSGGSASETVDGGQAVTLTGSESVDVESVPMPPPDEFDAWSEERDVRLTSSRSAQYVNPYTPGFDDLDEYGHWTDVVEYGPVWYPPVVSGWVPYRFGHWAWVDPWGWTWVEDEPWGFCPFHFGRWVLIGATWGWLPGPFVMAPVYAPAFVAFLGGGVSVGVGFVGWFPLGPGEPFFPWYHYSGNYLNVVNITNIRNVTNVKNITNISDINVHYAYRNVATTAVPPQVFSSGQHIANHVMHLSPQELAKAQVVPHPPVNPTVQAALPGKPRSDPPVRSRPVAAAKRIPAARNAAAAHPLAGNVAKNVPPRNAKPAMPAPNRTPLGAPLRAEPPRTITRAVPPPPAMPFGARNEAMLDHPGRPLEPPQVENLRLGRPAGPMRDHEFPVHPFPVVPARPVAPPPRPVAPVHPR